MPLTCLVIFNTKYQFASLCPYCYSRNNFLLSMTSKLIPNVKWLSTQRWYDMNTINRFMIIHLWIIVQPVFWPNMWIKFFYIIVFVFVLDHEVFLIYVLYSHYQTRKILMASSYKFVLKAPHLKNSFHIPLVHN